MWKGMVADVAGATTNMAGAATLEVRNLGFFILSLSFGLGCN